MSSTVVARAEAEKRLDCWHTYQTAADIVHSCYATCTNGKQGARTRTEGAAMCVRILIRIREAQQRVWQEQTK